MTFVDQVFFGNGAIGIHGKGHAPQPRKAIVKSIASSRYPGGKRVQCIIFNEQYTSCRCPKCKDKSLKLEKKEKEKEGEGEERKGEDESQPSKGNTNSESATLLSSEREFDEALQQYDGRRDVCSKCGTAWPHDVVSLVNMSHIARSILLGEERPHWLYPSEKASAVGAKRKLEDSEISEG